MEPDDVPEDIHTFAELFFGKNVLPLDFTDNTNNEPFIRKWLESKGLQMSVQGNEGAIGSKYTGIEPDSWYLTRWGNGHYVVYIDEDGYLYSLSVTGSKPYFDTFHTSSRTFNSGKGWNCHYIYDVGAMQGLLFPFINWNTNPFDTK